MLRKRKPRQHPYFSAGLSKLDQGTHRGCNYDQPAGMSFNAGWTAALGPQLLMLQEYKCVQIMPEIGCCYTQNGDKLNIETKMLMIKLPLFMQHFNENNVRKTSWCIFNGGYIESINKIKHCVICLIILRLFM